MAGFSCFVFGFDDWDGVLFIPNLWRTAQQEIIRQALPACWTRIWDAGSTSWQRSGNVLLHSPPPHFFQIYKMGLQQKTDFADENLRCYCCSSGCLLLPVCLSAAHIAVSSRIRYLLSAASARTVYWHLIALALPQLDWKTIRNSQYNALYQIHSNIQWRHC